MSSEDPNAGSDLGVCLLDFRSGWNTDLLKWCVRPSCLQNTHWKIESLWIYSWPLPKWSRINRPPDLLLGAGMEPGARGRHAESNPGSALKIETARGKGRCVVMVVVPPSCNSQADTVALAAEEATEYWNYEELSLDLCLLKTLRVCCGFVFLSSAPSQTPSQILSSS